MLSVEIVGLEDYVYEDEVRVVFLRELSTRDML